VVYLESAERAKCEKLSEVSANSICAQEKGGTIDVSECNVGKLKLFYFLKLQKNYLEKFQGKEYSGSPLMCQSGGEWHLVGISSWSKSCSFVGQRPRIYDRV